MKKYLKDLLPKTIHLLNNMFWKDSVKTAFKGLKTNKSRSLLTILGIVIGITSIIMILALGKGAEELILSEIRGMGSRTIAVEPGKEPSGPASFLELFTDSLKERDVEAIRKLPGVTEVAPMVVKILPLSYENESKRTTVIGTTEFMAQMLDVYPSVGVIFNEDDIRQKASVVVLGNKIKQDLFGDSNALGEKIRIKDRSFRVVGVFPPRGNIAFLNVDEMVLVPYTTAQEYLLGINYFNEIDVQAETEDLVPQVARDITLTLRELHNIDDPEKDDFHVMTQIDTVEAVSVVTGVLTLLLSSVAAISLVVGGIGIMNIMLVSVSERTREIGLRKAVGAKDKDILVQFLLEAVLLTSFGGILGITLGASLSFLIAVILSNYANLNWQFVFPLSAVFLGLGVSGAVGLFFGIFPARHAAKKSPIEALRYE